MYLYHLALHFACLLDQLGCEYESPYKFMMGVWPALLAILGLPSTQREQVFRNSSTIIREILLYFNKTAGIIFFNRPCPTSRCMLLNRSNVSSCVAIWMIDCLGGGWFDGFGFFKIRTYAHSWRSTWPMFRIKFFLNSKFNMVVSEFRDFRVPLWVTH